MKVTRTEFNFSEEAKIVAFIQTDKCGPGDTMSVSIRIINNVAELISLLRFDQEGDLSSIAIYRFLDEKYFFTVLDDILDSFEVEERFD